MTASAVLDTLCVDIPEISFVTPLPGLGDVRRFALVSQDDLGVLYSLQSLDQPDLRLIVVVPGAFFPDYAPVIDDETAASLGLETAEEALVFVVVTPAARAGDSTANLLAPIVIHRDTRAAAQVLLSGSDHPLRAQLVSA